MNAFLQQQIAQALAYLKENAYLPVDVSVDLHIERSRDEKNGDFSSNVAMLLAKMLKLNPRAVAQRIVDALPTSPRIKKVEIAGPGFINFFCDPSAFQSVIQDILSAGHLYGCRTCDPASRVHMEFVSSNPTGPLHVGHGRGAAFGASLANILTAAGYVVHREYYLNDAGRQMDILAVSVWLRYLQTLDVALHFPSNGYQGDYVNAIATALQKKYPTHFLSNTTDVMAGVAPDAQADGTGDKEKHIDDIIRNAKKLLGSDYDLVVQFSLQEILNDMKNDLSEFGVVYDQWFSERSLVDEGASDRAIAVLRNKGLMYEEDGALWFKSTQFGDDKDRVVKRANGDNTYFGNDIAYHYSKLERGYPTIIDVLGADHHGYTPRIRAVLAALTDQFELHVPLLQFVSLYRGREKVAMSTRSGDFVTLRELRKEVGNDAARFFYVMRRSDQPIDFDLELAQSTSNENPVFYIQYAHARVCSVLKQLTEKNILWQPGEGIEHVSQLTMPEEIALLKTLMRYPDCIIQAAQAYEPYFLVQYLRELAHEFHSYYNNHTFIVDTVEQRSARLNLIVAVRQVLINGLTLLGISAPDVM